MKTDIAERGLESALPAGGLGNPPVVSGLCGRGLLDGCVTEFAPLPSDPAKNSKARRASDQSATPRHPPFAGTSLCLIVNEIHGLSKGPSGERPSLPTACIVCCVRLFAHRCREDRADGGSGQSAGPEVMIATKELQRFCRHLALVRPGQFVGELPKRTKASPDRTDRKQRQPRQPAVADRRPWEPTRESMRIKATNTWGVHNRSEAA